MNIKEYYSIKSRLYLHQTILCAIVFSVVMIPAARKTDFFLVFAVGIFVFICIAYFFFRYLYFSVKSSSLPNPNQMNSPESMFYILMPSPVSSSNLHLYSITGFRRLTVTELKGKELKAQRKEINRSGVQKVFRIQDYEKQKNWHLYIEKQRRYLYSADFQLICTIDRQNKVEQHASINQADFHLKKNYFNISVLKNGNEVLTMRKGYMPFMLQKYFFSNSPVLKLDGRLKDNEKILCLSMMM